MPDDDVPDGDLPDGDLRDALEESRRLGFLGARPIAEVIEHARCFLPPIVSRHGPGASVTVLDLGAGGGVPGLIIANDLPSARVTLLDRRRTRTDFLERMVRRFGWLGRVDVLNTDADVVDEVRRHSFEWVVARGFGPPARTLEVASRWVRDTGGILISEPPEGDRWRPEDLARCNMTRCAYDRRVAWFERTGA
jgi:16S rRNA (guanine527-N7)-methyltransferase